MSSEADSDLDPAREPDCDPDRDPDFDPDRDPDPAGPAVRLAFDEKYPDLAMRPVLDVRPDLDEMRDTDLDDSSDTEDTLGLEAISGAVDGAVMDSGSGTAWPLICLERDTVANMRSLAADLTC